VRMTRSGLTLSMAVLMSLTQSVNMGLKKDLVFAIASQGFAFFKALPSSVSCRSLIKLRLMSSKSMPASLTSLSCSGWVTMVTLRE